MGDSKNEALPNPNMLSPNVQQNFKKFSHIKLSAFLALRAV